MAQWDGKPMPRFESRGKQVLDPRTAYQVVHMLEGVITRGTAVVLRDLNMPLFGKTGTTSGPTNVWFVGGSQKYVAGVYLGYDQPKPMGGYAQGGRIAAPVWKQWALTALKDQPKVPFVAPPGIRWVRIDRATGKRVFGVFPTTEDPKSSVIWEAFQPQTEPRRSYRGATGDPYNTDQQQQALQERLKEIQEIQAQQRQRGTVARPQPAQPGQPAPPTGGLPIQNTVQ
jgi:penicillin-binding protein 1A